MLAIIIIIQAITFVGFYFLLRFLFARQENEALARLNILHEENLVKEQQLTDELERAKKEGDAEIKRAKNEASQIIEEARNEAVRLRLNMEEQAKVKVNKIIADGQLESQREKEKYLKESQAHSLELAHKLVEALLSEKERTVLQHDFISATITEISKLPKEQFPAQVDKIKVVSAIALNKEQKDSLQKIINEKTGRTMTIEEAIKADLIGGLIVEIDGLVIDGTLKNKLQRILPTLKKK